MATLHYLLSTICVCVLFLCMYGTTVSSEEVLEEEEEVTNVTLSTGILKVATTHTATIECEAAYNVSVKWTNPNGTDVNALNTPRLGYDQEGTLQVVNPLTTDSGDYKCTTADGAFHEVAEVFVYVMPDYFIEGMIILGINAVLAVIFVGCVVRSEVRERKMKNVFKASRKATTTLG